MTPGATAINAALDAIDAALAPPAPTSSPGRQTLGGAVHDCKIIGVPCATQATSTATGWRWSACGWSGRDLGVRKVLTKPARTSRTATTSPNSSFHSPTEIPMFVFGSGVLIGTPQGGTPINFGLAQEISLNIATTTKALYGQYNFPVAIGSGTRKMTGKAKLARISGQALGSLFFGVTPSAGGTQTQFGEATSVPASSPYTYSTTFTRPSSPTRASSTPRARCR